MTVILGYFRGCVLEDLRPCTKIDEISQTFLDPVVLSYILLKQKVIAGNIRAELSKALEKIFDYAEKEVEENKITYIVIKTSNSSLRILSHGRLIISAMYEDKGGKILSGSNAVSALLNELVRENPLIRYTVATISPEDLPESLREQILGCISEKEVKHPPYVWLNKMLYDLYIEKIVDEKDPHFYVLKAKDKYSNLYLAYIPKFEILTGEEKLVQSTQTALSSLVKQVAVSLELYQVNENILGSGLRKLGYDPNLSRKVVQYKKYIYTPRAVIILKDKFTDKEYVETPPLFLFDYPDLGSVSEYFAKAKPTPKDMLYIGLSVSGVLAIMHILGYVHMNVKTDTIILKKLEEDVFNYIPILRGLSRASRILGETTELLSPEPEYSDPLSLLTGRASYIYDVYSLGITLYRLIMGRLLDTRLLLNFLILKYLYGSPVPLKVFIDKNKELASIYMKLDKIIRKIVGMRTKGVPEEMVREIISAVIDVEKARYKELRRLISSELAAIIEFSLSLDPNKRFKDAVVLWLKLIDIAKCMGLSEIIPV